MKKLERDENRPASLERSILSQSRISWFYFCFGRPRQAVDGDFQGNVFLGATGETNLAAHRRSNLPSRSRGISHITKAPGLLSPGQRPQRARAFKGPSKMAYRGISAG